MRATYRILAMLIAIGVVLQAAAVAWGFFDVLKGSGKDIVFDSSNPNGGVLMHRYGGSAIALLALLLLVISFFARIPDGVKLAGAVFGLTALQWVLAIVSFGAPIVGLLHGLNAFAMAGVASVAMRKARLAEAAPAEPAVAG